MCRWLWLGVVVVSLLAFLYMAYDCVQLYVKQSSSVVTSGNDNAPLARLPAVTICNVNHLRFIVLPEHSSKLTADKIRSQNNC